MVPGLWPGSGDCRGSCGAARISAAACQEGAEGSSSALAQQPEGAPGGALWQQLPGQAYQRQGLGQLCYHFAGQKEKEKVLGLSQRCVQLSSGWELCITSVDASHTKPSQTVNEGWQEGRKK